MDGGVSGTLRSFHGVESELRRFGGARAVRVWHRPHAAIPEHSHDWPTLDVFVCGNYVEQTATARDLIRSPSVVLQCAGVAHANTVGSLGLQMLGITFDPAWLGECGSQLVLARRCWLGGRASASARSLISAWTDPLRSERALVRQTRRFLERAVASEMEDVPGWIREIQAIVDLEPDAHVTTEELARRFARHPAWLARTYRAATGEGLKDARRRKRVERALDLLRTTRLPLVEVALAAGFCDQSHMNLSFRALLDRTPGDLRIEAERQLGVESCR